MPGQRKKVLIKRPTRLLEMIDKIERNTTTQKVGCKLGWNFKCPKTAISPKGVYNVHRADEARGMRRLLEILKGYPDFRKLIGLEEWSDSQIAKLKPIPKEEKVIAKTVKLQARPHEAVYVEREEEKY